MFKKIISIFLFLVLTSCAGTSSLDIARGLFGYIPPPEKTTISEEMQLEFERCMKIGDSDNCAQEAYDVVRRVKGLEPRAVPKGIVIILEGDGGHGSTEEGDKEKSKEQKTKDNPSENK